MATGDSQISNSARQLEAQRLNRIELERQAQEKLAKIEAERQEELSRLARSKQQALDLAKNQIERQRILDDLAKQQASKAEQERIAKVNAQAEIDRQKAIARVAGGTGTNIETLSGRVAIRDDVGRITSLSNVESQSALTAKSRITNEIARREVEARRVTDLERFLSNEQALARGQFTRASLEKQIAERKARGLSKTPQQKEALKRLVAQEDFQALSARNVRKRGRGRKGVQITSASDIISAKKAQAGTTSNFANPNFISAKGSSKSFQARARDNSLGQISSQLEFLQSRRKAGKQNTQDPFAGFSFGNFGGRDTTKVTPTQSGLFGVRSDRQTKSSIDKTRADLERAGAPLKQSSKRVSGATKAKKPKSRTQIRGLDIFVPDLRQSQTTQFGSLNIAPEVSAEQARLGIPFTGNDNVRQGNIFSVNLFENVRIDDAITPTRTRRGTRAPKKTSTPRTPRQNDGFGALQLPNLPEIVLPEVFGGDLVGGQINQAISNPQGVVDDVFSSANFLFDTGRNINFFDLTDISDNQAIRDRANRLIESTR